VGGDRRLKFLHYLVDCEAAVRITPGWVVPWACMFCRWNPIAPDPARQEASGGFAAGEAFIEPSAGDR
jgi:hypothetical protein